MRGERRRSRLRAGALLAGWVLGLAACRAPDPPFVLLLTSDTLRADRLAAYGSELGATPHLDALLAESQVYGAAYATCSYTLPSVSSILTGRFPEELGMQANLSRLQRGAATLAELLRLNGFRTGAVVSNWVLRSGTGVERGFDLYDDRTPDREINREMPERLAPDTTAAALAALDRLDPASGPVFLWVHYQDPHGPYTPPPANRERFLASERRAPDGRRTLPLAPGGFGGIPRYQRVAGPSEVAWYRAGYDGEVAQLDTAVGELLTGLEARGLRRRARIVFTADHGESLGEQDYWFAHGELLSDPLVRVPLAVRVPGQPPGRRDQPVSLTQVFATVLAIAGVDPPAEEAARALGAQGAAPPVYLAALAGAHVPRFGLVQGEWKYLRAQLRGGVRESLHRAGDESRNLADTHPEQLARLRQALQRTRAGLQRAPEQRQALGPEERARLHSLGYLEDAPPAAQ